MSENLKVGILGDPNDTGMIAICESVALKHKGMTEMNLSGGYLYAKCSDGAHIKVIPESFLRGQKLDEIWIPTVVYDELLNTAILPSVSYQRDRIHRWHELYQN